MLINSGGNFFVGNFGGKMLMESFGGKYSMEIIADFFLPKMMLFLAWLSCFFAGSFCLRQNLHQTSHSQRRYLRMNPVTCVHFHENTNMYL